VWAAMPIKPRTSRHASIAVDTAFHRARHGRSRTRLVLAGFAGSIISAVQMAHNGTLATINGPLTPRRCLSRPFSAMRCGAGRRLISCECGGAFKTWRRL